MCDNYPEDSLISLTHQRRGTGPRTSIRDVHTQIPKHDLNSGFLKMKTTKRSCSLSSMNRFSRNIWVAKLISIPNVKVFFPTDHVMYKLSSHVTTIKTEQGYPFILRMLQDMATVQHYYVRTVDSDIVVLVIKLCFFSTVRRLSTL